METTLGHIVSVATKPKTGSSREEAASRIIGKLMNLGALIERETNRLLFPHGLNHQQFAILFEIFRAGRVQQKDVTNRLLLERAHVSKVVKKLEDMGLIVAVPHPEDGRSAWLSLSKTGHTLVNTCRALFEARKREWFRVVDTSRLNQIVEQLAMLQAAFSESDGGPRLSTNTKEKP